jgi:membrane fusion protein, multidrug efflux system
MPRQRRLRRALFALLPLAVIAGAYWYVTGGQVMSTDDAYVEAEKVGVSTDVSAIVKEIDVSDDQRVDAGQVLYRLARSSARASSWGLGASAPWAPR